MTRQATLLLVAVLCATGCPKKQAAPEVPPKVKAPAPPTELRVRFFAAGHGDAVLLSAADGHHVLIDAGRAIGDHLVRRRLIPWFKQHRIKKLDAFIVTHPHPDHFGDPVALRKQVAFDTLYTNADGAVLLSNLSEGLERAGGRPVRVKTLARGDKLQFGELHLWVLWPRPDAKPPSKVSRLSEQNDRSLVIKVTFGAVKLLLTGDLTARGEPGLLNTEPDLHAHVLKLGHHGRGSTSEAWIRRVRPRYAVATCGDYLGRMQPVEPALEKRLERYKVKLYRTDKNGDVEVITDGTELTVRIHPEYIYRPKGLR